MNVALIISIIIIVCLIDLACYTQAPYPQRKSIGRTPFIGGPLALIIYGHKDNQRTTERGEAGE